VEVAYFQNKTVFQYEKGLNLRGCFLARFSDVIYFAVVLRADINVDFGKGSDSQKQWLTRYRRIHGQKGRIVWREQKKVDSPLTPAKNAACPNRPIFTCPTVDGPGC
jgi:hypothetical protein